MSVNFPYVDCNVGQSFTLEHHLFIFAVSGGASGLPEIQIVRCPAPGGYPVIAGIYVLRNDPLVAMKVDPNNGQPRLCINTQERPGTVPDIEVEILGANPQTVAQYWLFEDKMELEFFLGTDDQRVDCLRNGPGYSQHAVNTRIALSKAEIALGFDSTTGKLAVYYRLVAGTTGGYIRLLERSSL